MNNYWRETPRIGVRLLAAGDPEFALRRRPRQQASEIELDGCVFLEGLGLRAGSQSATAAAPIVNTMTNCAGILLFRCFVSLASGRFPERQGKINPPRRKK